jgi:ABC-type polysaccharide/polyol phosphate transport system ATPase subunit
MHSIILKNIRKEFIVSEKERTSVFEYLITPIISQKRVVVLEDITFSVKKGECLGVIGRNGVGKSTLLKIIAKIMKPSSGEVSVNGTIIPLIDLSFGFELELSGKENVYLYASLIGYKREEIDKKYDSLIEYFGFPKWIDKKLRYYSEGMKLRLAFAIVMISNPDILLIDEAITVGDSTFQTRSFAKIKEFKKQKKTIVFVSHDLNKISEICDSVIYLDNGKIVKEGQKEEVIDYYEKKLFEEDEAYLRELVETKNKILTEIKKDRKGEKTKNNRKETEEELIQYLNELTLMLLNRKNLLTKKIMTLQNNPKRKNAEISELEKELTDVSEKIKTLFLSNSVNI